MDTGEKRRPFRAAMGNHVRGNVVAYLALFFALGGTASATTFIVTSESQMGTNTVSSRVIADAQVKQADLAAPEAWHLVGAAGQPAWTITGCGDVYSCEFKNQAGGATEFYKDPYGVVHVRVNACYSQRFTVSPAGSGTCFGYQELSNTVGRKLFTLPAGYRPATNLNVVVPEFNGQNASNRLLIGSGGSVIMYGCVDCLYTAKINNQEFSFRAG